MSRSLEFQYATQTVEPPTGSQIRLDAAPAAATRMWIRNVTTPGEDVWRGLMLLGEGDRLYLQDFDDHDNAVAYDVTAAAIDRGSYVEVPIHVLEAVGTLPGQKVALVIVTADELAPPAPSPPPIFVQPGYSLGPLDVFASPAELGRALGNATGTIATDRRLAVALLVATRHVLHCLGYAFTDDVLPADPGELTVVPVAVRSSWRQATIAAAVRFYKSPDVPFGVAGGWDMATYVRMSIPDVDMILLGERVAFGIA